MNLGILILAGGKSSRMAGFDKSQLLYQNQTFLDILTNEFQEYDNKYISDNQFLKHHYPSYQTIIDEYDEIGPLSGIVSTFHQTNHDYLFVAGCDMPLIKKEVLLTLIEHLANYDGAMIQNKHITYPLGAIYSRNMLSVMESQIDKGFYSLKHVIDKCHVCLIPIEKTTLEKTMFKNINTKTDYQELIME